jgi:hypothetical protein
MFVLQFPQSELQGIGCGDPSGKRIINFPLMNAADRREFFTFIAGRLHLKFFDARQSKGLSQ